MVNMFIYSTAVQHYDAETLNRRLRDSVSTGAFGEQSHADTFAREVGSGNVDPFRAEQHQYQVSEVSYRTWGPMGFSRPRPVQMAQMKLSGEVHFPRMALV